MNSIKSKMLLSLGMALAAALLSWAYLLSQEKSLLRRGKMIDVIAANGYLPAYTHIQSGDLRQIQVPTEYAAKGAVTDESLVTGEMSLVPFSDGEILTYNKLAKNGQSLSNTVPEGKRAFTLPSDKVKGLNGLLRPGDLVDVLYLNSGDKGGSAASVSTLLQNIEVLAAGDLYADQGSKGESSGTVTLALNPEEAQLALLALAKGQLHLSLRSNNDNRLVSLGPVSPADLGSRVQRHPATQASPAPETFSIKKR
jgi:pilus assembly protein CpaB